MQMKRESSDKFDDTDLDANFEKLTQVQYESEVKQKKLEISNL
jgi:hypothetical protein